MTEKWWRPDRFAAKVPYLEKRAKVLAAVRAFLAGRGYLEVDTPALQASPCMEPHIQAFKVSGGYYLHTSPEFAMKKLLVAGLPKIFQLASVFRDEAPSRTHSPAFTMLEWYQRGMDYKEMMQETIDLVRVAVKEGIVFNGKSCDVHAEWQKITVVEALKKYAGIDIAGRFGDLLHLTVAAQKIGVYVSPHDDWENALLKIIMDKVEPHLGSPAPSILYDYPVSMAALARAKPEDPQFAERFEVYICSLELANAFGELTDAKVQRERFLHDVTLRRQFYGEEYPVDEDFLDALDHGLPAASGNALGIDRLVMLATGAADINLVQAAPCLPGRGWTALHAAAAAEAKGADVEEDVRALLAAGADPHRADDLGETPFNIAAPASPVTGRLMTLHWLAGAGLKDINDRSGSHGSTLGQYIAKWSHDDEVEAHFATPGLRIDIVNNSGWTPLSAAAAMGRVKVVEILARLYSPAARAARATESYTANYTGAAVVYGLGLDALGIVRARLAQDKGASEEMKRNLQRCIEILEA